MCTPVDRARAENRECVCCGHACAYCCSLVKRRYIAPTRAPTNTLAASLARNCPLSARHVCTCAIAARVAVRTSARATGTACGATGPTRHGRTARFVRTTSCRSVPTSYLRTRAMYIYCVRHPPRVHPPRTRVRASSRGLSLELAGGRARRRAEPSRAEPTRTFRRPCRRPSRRASRTARRPSASLPTRPRSRPCHPAAPRTAARAGPAPPGRRLRGVGFCACLESVDQEVGRVLHEPRNRVPCGVA